MISVASAQEIVFQAVQITGSERIAVQESAGRYLREPILADEDQPPFDRSAMDGYATCGEPQNGGWNIVGTSMAGTRLENLLPLVSGACVRIFTGAPVPAGADFVLPQEEVLLDETKRKMRLKPSAETQAGYIRRRGQDALKGAVLVESRTQITAVEMSLMASAGISEPLVAKRPRVVHVTSGDELVDPTEVPKPGQIRDSNALLILALVEAAGGQVVKQARVGDHVEEIINAVMGLDYDLLLISGGASVGDHDCTAPALESLGFQLVFNKINMRPGKPLIFGTNGPQLAFGLPGNPLSHFVVYHLFVKPVLSRMLGHEAPVLSEGVLAEKLADVANARETYWPVRVRAEAGELKMYPVKWNSSGHLASLVGVNGLMQIPANSVSLSAGTRLRLVIAGKI